jgi:hypothetical protein
MNRKVDWKGLPEAITKGAGPSSGEQPLVEDIKASTMGLSWHIYRDARGGYHLRVDGKWKRPEPGGLRVRAGGPLEAMLIKAESIAETLAKTVFAPAK